MENLASVKDDGHIDSGGCKFAARTDSGKIRELNEDSFFSNDRLGLWLVADGMGGHKKGEVASSIAAEVISQSVESGETLVNSIEFAHKKILQEAKSCMEASDMGTTVVVLQVRGIDYEIAWVGDSRAYLFDGGLLQITRDHSYVQDLVSSGAVSEEEARSHPSRHLLTQCLGATDDSEIQVSKRHGRFSENQYLLLCSDGLTDELSDQEIAEILESDLDLEGRADQLVDAALEKGGHDNITIILLSAPKGSYKSLSSNKNIMMLLVGSILAAASLVILNYLF